MGERGLWDSADVTNQCVNLETRSCIGAAAPPPTHEAMTHFLKQGSSRCLKAPSQKEEQSRQKADLGL